MTTLKFGTGSKEKREKHEKIMVLIFYRKTNLKRTETPTSKKKKIGCTSSTTILT